MEVDERLDSCDEIKNTPPGSPKVNN